MNKKISTTLAISIIVVLAVLVAAVVLSYQPFFDQKNNNLPDNQQGKPSKQTNNIEPSITVTSPNGGEILVPGQTYIIKWNAEKIKQVFNIAIRTSEISSLPSESSQSYEILMSSSFSNSNSSHINGHTAIKDLDTNTTSYSWTVPTDIALYEYNKIIVMGTPINCENGICGGPVSDWSDNYFTIQNYGISGEETCKTVCMKKGYSDGSCTKWFDNKSPESTCSDIGSNFISGKFSDCINNISPNVIGAGGVICCCK